MPLSSRKLPPTDRRPLETVRSAPALPAITVTLPVTVRGAESINKQPPAPTCTLPTAAKGVAFRMNVPLLFMATEPGPPGTPPVLFVASFQSPYPPFQELGASRVSRGSSRGRSELRDRPAKLGLAGLHARPSFAGRP